MRSALLVLLAVLLAGTFVWIRCAGGEPVPFAAPDEPVVLPPANAAPAATELTPASARVLIAITAKGRLVEPPPRCRVAVGNGTNVTEVEAEVLAGAGAGLLRAGPEPGRQLVRLAPVPGRRCLRVLHRTGSERAPELTFGQDVALRGRVLDAARRPVAGARVFLGEIDHAGAPIEVGSDVDGAFAATVAAGEGIPVVVRAKGFAWEHRVLEAGAAVAELLFVLAPESVVDVRCLVTADDLADAVAFPLPSGEVTTESLGYPWFAPVVFGMERLDARGAGVLCGLPRGSEVGVVVAHPSAAQSPPVAVALRREREQANVRLRLLPAIRGRVVGADGRPLVDALVLCRPAGREPGEAYLEGRLVPPQAVAAGCAVAWTGADGAFAVARPGGDRATLSVRAPGLAGLDIAFARGEGTLERELVLPPWRPGPPQLVVAAPTVVGGGAAGSWGCRVTPGMAEFAAVAAAAEFRRTFGEAWLVDLTVRVQRDGGVLSAPRLVRDFAIVGISEVPADLLQ